MFKKNISNITNYSIAIVFILIIVLSGYLIYPNISLNKTISKNNEPSDQFLFGNGRDEKTIEESTNYEKYRFNKTTLINDNRGVPILYYHSVRASADNEVTVTPKLLKSELQYLKDSGYITLTISELKDYLLNNSPIPKKSIVITFDDGYMDNYDNAFPILKELDLKATIFCITFKLDGSYYLSKDAIKEMSDYGIDIQSHTVNHSELDTMTYDKQLAEFRKSKELLESITGKSVDSIAYPYGKFNNDSIKAARNAGYSLGFTTNRGLADRSDNPLMLDRIYINSNYNLETFKQILSNTSK